ncbi:MAG: MFS transporter [Cellvibrionales bacterium]|nr:MFS transporter [Cellvibrionales bacterium]
MSLETMTEKKSLSAFFEPRVLALFFLGISAGIPLLLIFSSLSLWLREAGIDRGTVTFFSWAALAFSFKFVWAPVVGIMPIPFLTRYLGQRRSWLLLSQIAIVLSIVGMASVNPALDGNVLMLMAIAAIGLGFSAATQDVVIDAFRIETAPKDYQALLSSMYIAGYRVGMLISGAGALYLAALFGSSSAHYSYDAWRLTYYCMAGSVVIGIITTLLISEPLSTVREAQRAFFSSKSYLRFFLFFLVAAALFILTYRVSGIFLENLVSFLARMINNKPLAELLWAGNQLILALGAVVLLYRLFDKYHWVDKELVNASYVAPIKDFFDRFSAKQVVLILLLIALYRISDIVLGVISNVFYQDMGFTKIEIANVVKVFGLIMTLLGGFLGGAIALRFGVIKSLFIGALATVLTNLLFMLMAQKGHDVVLFYFVISADNLAGGFAGAAFVAYLSSLVNLSFTASQYAIFSSLMTLFPKVLAGFSGTLVNMMGYSNFFLFASIIGLPVLVVIYLIRDIDCDETS